MCIIKSTILSEYNNNVLGYYNKGRRLILKCRRQMDEPIG